MAVLTIDFHNTLVECDEWFDLEVHTLVSSVLEWISAHMPELHVAVDGRQADLLYRKLRLAINQHGHELDAYRSVMTVLDRLGVALPDITVREAVDARMREMLEFATPVAGAHSLLEQAHASGFRVGVVSIAIHHEFLEWALDRFGMSTYIEQVTTSASAGFHKARPEIYWAALAALGERPARGLHIGDSLRFDVGGAQQAGMSGAWFDRKSVGVQANDEHTPSFVVNDMGLAHEPALALLSAIDLAP